MRRGSPGAPGRQPPEDPESVDAATGSAVRILAAAAQSADGLRVRLRRRGYSEAAAAAATAEMTRLGYVDDAALAASLVARRRLSGRGRVRVAAELRERGVPGDVADAALADVDPSDERAAALDVGRRVWHSPALDRPGADRRGRTGAALARRGFDTETIHAVLRALERGD